MTPKVLGKTVPASLFHALNPQITGKLESSLNVILVHAMRPWASPSGLCFLIPTSAHSGAAFTLLLYVCVTLMMIRLMFFPFFTYILTLSNISNPYEVKSIAGQDFSFTLNPVPPSQTTFNLKVLSMLPQKHILAPFLLLLFLLLLGLGPADP